ncbi:SDR family oxidoreductase [Nonomuraea sp. NPDC003201]
MTEAHRPVAIVTGANRGTGLAIAAELHAGGWDVWGLNRTSAGQSWLPEARCDLQSADAVTAAVETVARRRGRIDALVVNAVARSLGRIGTLSLPDWRAAFDVNIVSVLPLLQAALPYLRPRRGSIVLMGSHAGSRYFEGGGAYCASKAALKALAEVLLLEERPNGVRTTLINPGAIANEIGDDSPFKLSTSSVAQAVRWVVEAPADTAIGEIELRPAHLPAMAVTGLNRLQAV